MRYLLLSVFVVCMIGVMIPSVIAEFNPETDCPVFGREGMPEEEKIELIIQERQCSGYPSTSEVASEPESIEPTGNLDKLIPEEYYPYNEQYSALKSPNPGEIPFIEFYMAGVKHPEVYGAVQIWKYSSNDIAKQFTNDFAMALGFYGDVNLTYDSSCKAGVARETPALLCSKNDVTVYVAGNGNIGKLTTAVLGNIKSPFMPIEPLYIIIGVVAIGGVIGAIAVAKRGSKTPKPAKEEAPKEEPKKETSGFCENCGNSLKPTTKFCGKCGNQV